MKNSLYVMSEFIKIITFFTGKYLKTPSFSIFSSSKDQKPDTFEVRNRQTATQREREREKNKGRKRQKGVFDITFTHFSSKQIKNVWQGSFTLIGGLSYTFLQSHPVEI